ncbi:sulfurtransferase TusA family protein [Tahibacter amnicola]|uniref:Sulfurtransferase TusA family protein n=1 Tax=Tahibacter amnicola TaxID=2976241 RepID=A0ABY6BMK2_9GAMM|nr:sulfurtransferase TusA family protein [Tahibacter amnicola]UXI69042.1 sulfurtransferase TusA family protein [Tahibacter amnicola]
MPTRAQDYDILVDARGLVCPQPLRRLRAALRDALPSQVICLVADDPHALIDVQVHCTRVGHVLLDESADEGVLRLLIRKREEPQG